MILGGDESSLSTVRSDEGKDEGKWVRLRLVATVAECGWSVSWLDREYGWY